MRKNNSKVEKVGRKHSVNWNHTDLILNWNQNLFDSIHIDTDHTKSNKLNPANSTNIGSIHGSENIRAIEKILASLVHSTVHTSPIFTYGSSIDPPSAPHDPLTEIMIPKGNTNPHNNPPNLLPNVPADPDS